MRLWTCSREEQERLFKAVLQQARVLRLTATGPSMAPTIFSGDALEVRRIDGPWKVGGIYLFRSVNGHWYAHRFIRREGERLIFKGDHLTLEDAAIFASQVIGEVTAVWRQSLPGAPRISLRLPGLQRWLAYYHRLRPWVGVARKLLFEAR